MSGVVEYADWNRAIGEAFFGPHAEGELVYLDSDADAFREACRRVGVAEDEAGDSLGSSVRSLLNLRGSHGATFANFDQMTTQWARRRRKAVRDGERTPLPPIIGLLMIFSMAAERMGARDPGTVKTEAGYYAQLERFLRIPVPDSTRIRTSFRATSETYWEALSLWLEDLDGAYGLPSAHALTHRYVGLPISQALIRDTERRHMHSMFVDQGFVVGVPVSQEEMRDAIENWIHSPSAAPNAAFRKMWASEETRPKIADAAIAELLAWDGDGIVASRGTDAKTNAGQGRCLLTVRERRKALKRTYALGLAVKRVRSEAGDATIRLAGNETATIDVSTSSSGLADLRTPAEIAPDSLLEGEVIVEWADGSRARRAPRRVVVFGQDAASGSYIEIDRIVPSLTSRLLVKDEGDLVAAAEAILEDAAAPGFKRVDGPSYDLPLGWVLFSDVQLLRAPRSEEVQRHRDLSCLEPRMSTQLAIQGGLRLPGRIPKWVAGRGMHVLVTADGETPVDLVRITTNPETLQAEERCLAREVVPPASVPLTVSEGGEDIVLSLRRGNSVLQELKVRVRSSNSPREATLPAFVSLCHDAEDRLWPLTAVPFAVVGDLVVDGMVCSGESCQVDEVSVPRVPDWVGNRVPMAEQKMLRVPAVDSNSCLVTGKHIMQLPTFDKRPRHPWMYGTCRECHISKRYPTWPRKSKEVENRPGVRDSQLPATAPLSSWPDLIEAITYLGRGAYDDFRFLARQVEDSAFFVRHALTSLDGLAVIEVERDRELRPVGWETAPTCAAELPDGGWVLTGHWPRELKESVLEETKVAGGWRRATEGSSVSLTIVGGVDPSDANEIFEGHNVEVVPSAGLALATVLPRLSDVLEGVPRAPMPSVGEALFFDLGSAQWRPISHTTLPGAYKISNRFRDTYLFRSREDVSNGTARRVLPELAKHLAAMGAARPIVRYDPDRELLRVPAGCELPGLFARSAIMCSGELPQFEAKSASLAYPNVSAEVAGLLVGKVMS